MVFYTDIMWYTVLIQKDSIAYSIRLLQPGKNIFQFNSAEVPSFFRKVKFLVGATFFSRWRFQPTSSRSSFFILVQQQKNSLFSFLVDDSMWRHFFYKKLLNVYFFFFLSLLLSILRDSCSRLNQLIEWKWFVKF